MDASQLHSPQPAAVPLQLQLSPVATPAPAPAAAGTPSRFMMGTLSSSQKARTVPPASPLAAVPSAVQPAVDTQRWQMIAVSPLKASSAVAAAEGPVRAVKSKVVATTYDSRWVIDTCCGCTFDRDVQFVCGVCVCVYAQQTTNMLDNKASQEFVRRHSHMRVLSDTHTVAMLCCCLLLYIFAPASIAITGHSVKLQSTPRCTSTVSMLTSTTTVQHVVTQSIIAVAMVTSELT